MGLLDFSQKTFNRCLSLRRVSIKTKNTTSRGPLVKLTYYNSVRVSNAEGIIKKLVIFRKLK